jgi:hypothetical protein
MAIGYQIFLSDLTSPTTKLIHYAVMYDDTMKIRLHCVNQPLSLIINSYRFVLVVGKPDDDRKCYVFNS